MMIYTIYYIMIICAPANHLHIYYCVRIFTNRVSVGSLTYIQCVRRISLICIYIILSIVYDILSCNILYICIFIYASVVCVYLLFILYMYDMMYIGSTSRNPNDLLYNEFDFYGSVILLLWNTGIHPAYDVLTKHERT